MCMCTHTHTYTFSHSNVQSVLVTVSSLGRVWSVKVDYPNVALPQNKTSIYFYFQMLSARGHAQLPSVLPSANQSQGCVEDARADWSIQKKTRIQLRHLNILKVVCHPVFISSLE